MKRYTLLLSFALVLMVSAGYSNSRVNKEASYQEAQKGFSAAVENVTINFVASEVATTNSPELTPKLPTVSALKDVYSEDGVVLNKGSPAEVQKLEYRKYRCSLI